MIRSQSSIELWRTVIEAREMLSVTQAHDISLWCLHMWYRAATVYLFATWTWIGLGWMFSGSSWSIAILLGATYTLWYYPKTVLRSVAISGYRLIRRWYRTDRALSTNRYSQMCDQYVVDQAQVAIRSWIRSIWSTVFADGIRCCGAWQVSYKLPEQLITIAAH